jgi:protein-arginine kinase
MTLDQVIAANRATRQNHPENLMARHFDEDYFRGLDEPLRHRLTKIIASGIENPDSQMGAYAMNPDDYDQFAPMFDPMIRDFHGLPGEKAIVQQYDWDTSSTLCDLSAIDDRLKDVSMRVRVARNLSTFPLPGAMSKEQRVALEDLAAKAFANLREDATFGGCYLSITPGSPHEINAEEYDQRVSAHQMFKDMSGDRYLNAAGISADWPYGRGMYVSKAEDFLVWVGEEDHLRIMAMQRGSNLNAMFDRLRTGLERMQDLLPAFATSLSYGNVTSCPTNLGAGMRASLHMMLPSLTSNGQDLDRVKRKAKALGLAVRGAGGEHSDAGKGGLVDISPSARLGVTEMKIMRRLYDGAAALWQIETA